MNKILNEVQYLKKIVKLDCYKMLKQTNLNTIKFELEINSKIIYISYALDAKLT